jgi:hypothetical protein
MFKRNQRILFLITGLGWLVVLSTFLFPLHTFQGNFWSIVGLLVAGLSAASVGSILFAPKENPAPQVNGLPAPERSTAKKTFIFIFSFLLTALTGFVAFIILAIISFSRDPHSLSTYGTPIYRPKVK